ncbi:UNVERIFIED_CONTAM: hypothetical protein Sradi_3966600 [Sesamum radiatum]|uniref:Retrotransposon gag domain-containing protein n=1 Tax=Sesamum radiatum TaxID=300843 RepID=A0AAW2PJD7_SESRA
MDFHCFDGENARSWVRRCIRCFQLIPIPDDQKVPIASVYMQGKAELWYQGYTKKKVFQSWDELVVNVLDRFEDLDNERVMTEFNKLHHETTVNACLEKLEELRDQMLLFNKNLDEEFFMTKLNSGLKEEIKSFVSTHNPTSFNQAVILARKQENAMNAILRKAQQPNRHVQSKPPYKPTSKNLPSKPIPQTKRCKFRKIYMLMSDEEVRDFDRAEQEEGSEGKEETEEVTISIHAMKGNVSYKTLRINGLVGDKETLILIDYGSTHCFLD